MFKGSPRSQQLLSYIVEKALSGDFDLLKERLLGTELFGRPAGYDTGGDAIVRVAASDVRKRLYQFYGSGNVCGRIRIDLSPGSYVPAFSIDPAGSPDLPAPQPVPEARPFPRESLEKAPGQWIPKPARRFAAFALVAAALLAALLFRPYAAATASPINDLPWSALFPRIGPPTDVILSDANLSALQSLLDFRITLSDYANRRYLPEGGPPLSPEMRRIAGSLAGIDYTAATTAINAVMVLRASQIAGVYSSRIRVRPARSVQLHDFDTDDNFILVGSPSSDPWSGLFASHLDFVFGYDAALKTEFIENKHPRAGEVRRYVPTAHGGATGRTFGIIALIRNPNRSGHVLLLAGTTTEATEAALELVCRPGALAALLRRQGVPESGPPSQFEILLAVEEMAGAPSGSDVAAVHLLTDPPPSH